MRRAISFLALAALAGGVFAEGMKPGQWEVASTMSGMNMPAMPAMSAAERQQMAAMGVKLPGAAGGGFSSTFKYCVSKEQAEKRLPPETDEDKRQGCKQSDIKLAGNTVTWRVECSGEQKMSGQGTVTYEGSDRYKGESTFKMNDPQHGAMTMKQSYNGKWLAPVCK
ncbi:MAG TPA: DUF3617 domain-containing protein [Rhodocyclaceae bacterium]|nr:DUF3617 domain-containing protein [Rhodocyclaceae bacterium]